MNHPRADKVLPLYNFTDDNGKLIEWTDGQKDIIEAILARKMYGKRRVHIMCSTQYGKSTAVAAGILIRVSAVKEPWAIVAANEDKAGIIMNTIIRFATDDPKTRALLDYTGPIDKLRRERNRRNISFRGRGQVRTFTADVKNTNKWGQTLLGFGSQNVVEDDSALIPDQAHAQVMRMLGGARDNFMVKIGNPFVRNHFLKSSTSDRYAKVVIDHKRALKEGRFDSDFIEEMREQPYFDILYACKFPDEDLIDGKGWIPLFSEGGITLAQNNINEHVGTGRLGVDVAAGGSNESIIIYRSMSTAEVVFKGHTPNTMELVGHIIHWMEDKSLDASEVFVDSIGVGQGVVDRLKEQGYGIHAVNVQRSPMMKDNFSNLRAEAYWGIKKWLKEGGKLVPHGGWKQLNSIKYKANSTGKVQIMPKDMMRSQLVPSPDVADALMLTFARPDGKRRFIKYEASQKQLANI